MSSHTRSGIYECVDPGGLAIPFNEFAITRPSSRSNLSCAVPALGPNLGDLCTEILHQIASHLTQDDISSLRLVSKACLRVDIRCMVRTLSFRITVAGLAKLREICVTPNLSFYVRRLEFCAHWKGDLRFVNSTLKAIKRKRKSHRVIVKELIHHGSLAFPYTEKKSIKTVTDAFKKLKKAGPTNINDLSYDLIVEHIRLCTPLFRNLQSMTIFENGLKYEWQLPNRISISQVAPTKPASTFPNYSDNFHKTSKLARNLLDVVVFTLSQEITDCEINWQFFNQLGEVIPIGDLEQCLKVLKSAFKRLSVRLPDLDPDMDIVRRDWSDNSKAFYDHNVSNTLRRHALGAMVGRLTKLEELELVFCYKTALVTPQTATRSQDSRDYLCNYMYLTDPDLLVGTAYLRKLHIEAAAILQQDFAMLLLRTLETLRDLTLVSIEWAQDASLFLMFKDFQLMHCRLEKVMLHGVHKEVGERRFLYMDGSISGDIGAGQGIMDRDYPWTIGDCLGRICSHSEPVDRKLQFHVLEWLEESLPPTDRQRSKWTSIKEFLNIGR